MHAIYSVDDMATSENVYVFVMVYVYAFVHDICLHVCICTYIHTYIRRYTHAYTHTHRLATFMLTCAHEHIFGQLNI